MMSVFNRLESFMPCSNRLAKGVKEYYQIESLKTFRCVSVLP